MAYEFEQRAVRAADNLPPELPAVFTKRGKGLMNLNKLIEKLAAFEPNGAKVISIYLNAQAGQNGRDDYGAWLKTQFYEYSVQFEHDAERARGYSEIQERINDFLENEADKSANGLAIFAAVGGDDFFETVQLDEPFSNNRFFVFDRPHLF